MPRRARAPQSGQYSNLTFSIPTDGCFTSPYAPNLVTDTYKLGKKLLQLSRLRWGGVRTVDALSSPEDPNRSAILTAFAQAFAESTTDNCLPLDPAKVYAGVGTPRDHGGREFRDANGNLVTILDGQSADLFKPSYSDNNPAVSPTASKNSLPSDPDGKDLPYGIFLPINGNTNGTGIVLTIEAPFQPPVTCDCPGSSSASNFSSFSSQSGGSSSGFFSSSSASKDECEPIFDSSTSSLSSGFFSSGSTGSRGFSSSSGGGGGGSFVSGDCIQTGCGYA